MRTQPIRQLATALGVAMTVAALGPVSPAQAADAVVHAPLGESASRTDVVAAWGSKILVDTTYAFMLTTDGGATWQPAALDHSVDLDSVDVGKAVFTDYASRVVVLDLASNLTAGYAMPSGFEVWGANATTAVIGDDDPTHPFLAHNLATGAEVELATTYLAEPTGTKKALESVYVFAHEALDLVDYSDSSSNQFATDIDIVDLDGSDGHHPFRVSGFVAYATVLGDQVEIVKKTGRDVFRCLRSMTQEPSAPVCTRIATLASSSHSVVADRSGGALRLELNGVDYLWESGALIKVSFSGSSGQFEGSGTPTRPLMRVENGSVGAIYRVMVGGTAQKLFGDLKVPARPFTVDLAAGRLVGNSVNASWTRSYSWTRAIGTDSIAGEAELPSDGYIVASAGRVTTDDTHGLTFYDRGVRTGTAPVEPALLDASGPYVLARQSGDKGPRKILTSAGTVVAATSPLAIFGTRYVGRAPDVNGAPRLFVKDLANPAAPAVVFGGPPSSGLWDWQDTAIWGDWVTFAFWTGTGTDIYACNYVTGAPPVELKGADEVLDIGDGVALVRDDNGGGGALLWDFVSNKTLPILVGSVASLDDGNRVAYFDATGLAVARVEGMGLSAPRLLGAVASATFNPNLGAWTAQFDATKALSSGTVEISHGTGPARVVDRVIPLPASSDGSLRGISWNGKDAAGHWVPDGQYAWTLKNFAAADGTGYLVAVDGHSPAAGKIALRTVDLGKVSAVRPRVSDTTPRVDQTLTARPGAWKPASALLTYQWFRGSSPIPAATSASYVVQPADKGHTLKVRVTGSCPGTEPYCRGYSAASKTSARTSKVAGAVLTPVAVPVLDDTTPTVDQRITGTVGAWGPSPVALTFRWYRVRSSGRASTISGATAATYTPTGRDVGYRLKLKVTGRKTGYSSRSVSSLVTRKVAKAAFGTVGDPTVTGSPALGMPLTAAPGTTDPNSKTSLKWYRGTRAIRGARAVAYRTTSADVGKPIRVRVTHTRPGYATAVRWSTPTRPILPGLVAVTPKLDDTTPHIDQVLGITASSGSGAWVPGDTTPAYQWFRGSSAIGGATQATYKVLVVDLGFPIKVQVTGSKAGYASVTRTSAATSPVARSVFVSSPAPVIHGLEGNTAHVGQTLTATNDGWTPAPDYFVYTWFRSGVMIDGAQPNTYVLVPADAGQTITVRVTAFRAGYDGKSVMSAPTGVILVR